MSDTDERTRRRRDRGIALVIVGAIPTLAGFASLRGTDGLGYTSGGVQAAIIIGLLLIGAGVMLLARARC